ncbi:MAG: HEPN domain-containing protein [Chloroflexi bacterium]|nr:HEPN domain-containing protein [Chloroflexota bacterium]MBI4504694.1 HEPN domain-containing protein [Chloroflexota bacterium]
MSEAEPLREMQRWLRYSELTEWALEARYPGDWPDATEADAHTAVQQAEAVWSSVIRDLKERGIDVAGKQA